MNLPPNPDPRKPPFHRNPLEDGIRQNLVLLEIARENRKKQLRTMWRASLLGGFCVLAVFAGLEALKREPQTQDVLTVEVREVKPVVVKQVFPEVAGKPDQTPTVPPPAVAPDPVTPEPAVPESDDTVAGIAPTETQLLDKEAALLLTGQDARRDAAMARDRKLIERVIKGKAWDAYRDLLGRSVKEGMALVRQGQGLNRFDPFWNEPVFYQALLRWRLLGWFSGSEIGNHVSDAYTGEMITWLLHNTAAMEELLMTLSPKDDEGQVLQFLMEAWSAGPEIFQKYFSLALACAVVFDQPMGIPHQISSKEFPAESQVAPMRRFLWYVEKNEMGKLAAPVHRSSARDLIWVVCAPITTSEMEWSLRKMPLRRKTWGNAYGMVEYLMERAVGANPDDPDKPTARDKRLAKEANPYKEYSFEEILKEGGICGDQSYFCVNTARAQGIPAMILSGETDLGGHAWAGIKIDDDQWTTAVGRVGGVSKGETDNPQTGTSITEQEIHLWNDRNHLSPNITLSVWRHFWIGDFFASLGDDENNAAAVKLASKIGPSFTETWTNLYALLEKQMQLAGDPPVPNNLGEWKDFARDMRRQFKDNPRMGELAANAELEYIFPYGDEGDAKRSLLRERRRLNRDASEQKDLIADSLKREADLILKRGGPNAKREIGQLYDRALRDYGGSITGFKMMAENYFGFMKDDKDLARKAARDIELAFKRVVETGTTDWFRAKTESSIYEMICGYYRAAGDPERADMLEKRYQILLRRAKRSAI
jgi:hypothetical protein